MSRTLAANYSTENDKASKDPVVRVTFNGVTRGYTSGTYDSYSANDRKFILAAKMNLQKFDMLSAPFASIGQTTFEILDKGDDVTAVMEGDNLVGVDITTSLGFQAIGTADFLNLPVTTIDSTEFNEGNLSFRFISGDARKFLSKKLFESQHSDKLNGAITNTASSITVDDVTGFLDPTNQPAFMNDGGTQIAHIIIENELMSYTGVNGGVQFTGVSRGVFETDQVAHDDNVFVKQVFIWRNTPPHVALLNILMTTNDASGHAYYDMSNYDNVYKVIGDIGLTATEVDTDEIQQVGYVTATSGVNSNFIRLALVKEFNAITFIEENILKPMGWFMYMKNNGKLTIKSFDRLYVENSFSSVLTLDNDEIASVNMNSREDLMINTIVLQSPETFTGSGDRSAFLQAAGTYQHDESVAAYGSTKNPLTLDTTSFAGRSSTLAINDYLYKWFYFFGNTPATLRVRVKYKNIKLEPGDWVQITRSSLPQLRDGTKGWATVKGLITGQRTEPLGSNPLEYDVFVWDLYDRVTNTFTINSTTVTDDTTVTFSATNSAVVEAADGHQDFGGTPTIDWIMFTVSITKPNETPAGSWETIGLSFHIQNPKATDTIFFDIPLIPYFTEDSDTIVYEFLFAGTTLAGSTLATAKVDWYQRSTATAGKQVTVAFDTVKYGTFDNTISAV